MIDFDPGELYEEGYEDGLADSPNEPDAEPEEEYDEDGNLLAVGIGLGAAAGFGYHMSKDERESLEEGLEQEEMAEDKIVKVPLSSRGGEGKATKGTPFERWAHDVNRGLTDINDDIEYTPEEIKRILKNEIVEE